MEYFVCPDQVNEKCSNCGRARLFKQCSKKVNLLAANGAPAGFSFDTTSTNAKADDNCDKANGIIGTTDFITIPQASESNFLAIDDVLCATICVARSCWLRKRFPSIKS